MYSTVDSGLTYTSTVRSVKAVNDAAERGRLNVGGGASAVFERTLATFSAKNRLKDYASIAHFAGTRPRPSRTSTDCHSLRGLHQSASILSCRRSWRYLRRCSYQAAFAEATLADGSESLGVLEPRADRLLFLLCLF